MANRTSGMGINLGGGPRWGGSAGMGRNGPRWGSYAGMGRKGPRWGGSAGLGVMVLRPSKVCNMSCNVTFWGGT